MQKSDAMNEIGFIFVYANYPDDGSDEEIRLERLILNPSIKNG